MFCFFNSSKTYLFLLLFTRTANFFFAYYVSILKNYQLWKKSRGITITTNTHNWTMAAQGTPQNCWEHQKTATKNQQNKSADQKFLLQNNSSSTKYPTTTTSATKYEQHPTNPKSKKPNYNHFRKLLQKNYTKQSRPTHTNT